MELRKGFDPTILILTVSLTCFGVVMVYSASSIMAAKKYADEFYFLKRQGIYAVLGFILMATAMQIDYHVLRKLAVPFFLFCTFLLALVLVPGIGANVGGASRWIRMPGFNIQPSELAKLGLVIYMAHSLTKKGQKVKNFKLGFIPYMLVLALLLALLLAQPDMGSSITLAAIAVIMLLMAGTRISYILSVILISAPFLYYGIMHKAYRRKRILAFLNPWEDPERSGYQIIQSWIGVGSGGPFGKGLGQSMQKLFFLPEAHTDFIFAVIGEELGFVGVVVVATMFLVLVLKGFRTALTASDEFGRNLAFGITLLLGSQAFINMMVVLGMLPTKGLALPMLSYGGTSLLVTLAAVGILLNISSQCGQGEKP